MDEARANLAEAVTMVLQANRELMEEGASRPGRHTRASAAERSMKRLELIRHLERHGCQFLREGGNHTIYVNRPRKKSSSVPRHREILEFTARKIYKDLPLPGRIS